MLDKRGFFLQLARIKTFTRVLSDKTVCRKVSNFEVFCSVASQDLKVMAILQSIQRKSWLQYFPFT